MNLDILLLILWTESSFKNEKRAVTLSLPSIQSYFVASFFWKVVW